MRMKLLKLRLKEKIVEYKLLALNNPESAIEFNGLAKGLEVALIVMKNIPRKPKVERLESTP